MKSMRWITAGAGVMLPLLAVAIALMATQLTRAQEAGPSQTGQSQGGAGAASIAPGAIPIQGRLADASGMALTGTYTVTFSLYEAAEGGPAVCSDVRPVSVADGLFSDYMDHCYTSIIGQKLYLGVKVGTDPEMTPRQVILPVPYALSLVPGAVISATLSNKPALSTFNYGTWPGISVYSQGGDAVYGRSDASNHAAVSGENSGGGIGLYGYSGAGPALYAAGSGIIRSTALSYVWISGNSARKYQNADSTIIDANGVGGATIKQGAAGAGTRYVVLPITVSGPVYGQNVTVSQLELYWRGDTALTAIVNVRLRRQTGPNGYADIIFDQGPGGAGYTCEDGAVPDGCTVHLDLSTNNVLTSNSGILYLVVGLGYTSDTDWVQLGGARLTLKNN
jgi:hypothetical protein